MAKYREIADAAERVDEACCVLDDLTAQKVALDAKLSSAQAEWQSATYELNELSKPLTAAAVSAALRQENTASGQRAS